MLVYRHKLTVCIILLTSECDPRGYVIHDYYYYYYYYYYLKK